MNMLNPSSTLVSRSQTRPAERRKLWRKRGRNIRGLAFDSSGGRLCIGFRTPLFDDKALLVALERRRRAFMGMKERDPQNELVLLDLDGDGIRDLAHCSSLGGWLILSQREAQKRRRCKLWLWSGDPSARPKRVRVSGSDHLDRAEGITPLTLAGKQKLLLGRGDADLVHQPGAKGRIIDFSELRVESEESAQRQAAGL